MVHGCEAARNHASREAKQPIKIRNEDQDSETFRCPDLIRAITAIEVWREVCCTEW